jgi:hypothetical protein
MQRVELGECLKASVEIDETEAFELAEGLGGELLGVAALNHARDELFAEPGHAPGVLERRHGPAKLVRLAGREARAFDGDAHRLLLEQRHAERLAQHPLQFRCRIVDGLAPFASAQITLALVHSLAKAGFEVWTPVKTITKRRSRSTETRDVTYALTPTYVFAKANQLLDLLAEAANPAADHPKFKVARWAGKFPMISDRGLDTLRKAQGRKKPEKAARTFRPGETVRTPDGPFAGIHPVKAAGRSSYC